MFKEESEVEHTSHQLLFRHLKRKYSKLTNSPPQSSQEEDLNWFFTFFNFYDFDEVRKKKKYLFPHTLKIQINNTILA